MGMGDQQPQRRRKNASRESTRQELLETARLLLAERGFDTALSLRLTEVTKAAGLTTGAAYQLWAGGQADFHRELAEYLIERDAGKGASSVADRAAETLLEGRPLADVIESSASAYLDEQLNELGFAVLSHYWPAARTHPELAGLVKDGYGRFHDSFTEIYAALIDHFGLELQPGVTIDDLTVAMSAVADGFVLRAGVDPDRMTTVTLADDDGTPREWSLFAASLAAIVRAMTRPRSMNS